MTTRQQRRARERAPVKKRRKGSLTFIAVVTALLLAGGAAVFFFSQQPVDITRGAIASEHWHAPYEFQICGNRLMPYPANEAEIHTHGDGQIHIHPTTQEFSADNANLGAFLQSIETRITVDEDGDRTLFLPDGTRYEGGQAGCEGDDNAYDVQVLNKGEAIEGDPNEFVLHNEDNIVIHYGPEPDPEASPIPFPGAPIPGLPPGAQVEQPPAEAGEGAEPADGAEDGSAPGDGTGTDAG